MKNTSIPRLAGSLFFVLLLISGASARASVIFNWPTSSIPWAAGTPTGGQTATAMFTSVNPNDITVSVNNSGAGPQGMVFNSQYPSIPTGAQITGGFTNVNSLQMIVSSSQAFGNYIQTTVSFATPVANLSFQIWDVDAHPGQFVDKIANIQALAFGGGTVGPDSVTSVTPGFNTITGSGLSTVVLGTADANDNSNQGSINFVFNAPVTQFSFQWSNNDPGLGQQGIALGPLTYTPVPESGSFLGTAAACLTVVGFELLRRKKNTSRR